MQLLALVQVGNEKRRLRVVNDLKTMKSSFAPELCVYIASGWLRERPKKKRKKQGGSGAPGEGAGSAKEAGGDIEQQAAGAEEQEEAFESYLAQLEKKVGKGRLQGVKVLLVTDVVVPQEDVTGLIRICSAYKAELQLFCMYDSRDAEVSSGVEQDWSSNWAAGIQPSFDPFIVGRRESRHTSWLTIAVHTLLGLRRDLPLTIELPMDAVPGLRSFGAISSVEVVRSQQAAGGQGARRDVHQGGGSGKGIVLTVVSRTRAADLSSASLRGLPIILRGAGQITCVCCLEESTHCCQALLRPMAGQMQRDGEVWYARCSHDLETEKVAGPNRTIYYAVGPASGVEGALCARRLATGEEMLAFSCRDGLPTLPRLEGAVPSRELKAAKRLLRNLPVINYDPSCY